MLNTMHGFPKTADGHTHRKFACTYGMQRYFQPLQCRGSYGTECLYDWHCRLLWGPMDSCWSVAEQQRSLLGQRGRDSCDGCVATAVSRAFTWGCHALHVVWRGHCPVCSAKVPASVWRRATGPFPSGLNGSVRGVALFPARKAVASVFGCQSTTHSRRHSGGIGRACRSRAFPPGLVCPVRRICKEWSCNSCEKLCSLPETARAQLRSRPRRLGRQLPG